MIKKCRGVWLATSAFAGLSAFVSAGAASAQGAPAPTYQFDIPAEPLGQALTDFSTASAQQIIMSEDVAKGRVTKGLHGRYTTREALNLLLADTGLVAESSASGVLMVKSKNGEAAQIERAADTQGSAIEMVTVTAEKREESSQNVPMSLTALSGEQLARQHDFRFEDYVGSVPGLTLIDNGPIGSQLVIRGMTTGSGSINSLVATYIDETPYTAVGLFSGSSVIAPNLDTFDMQRIEVLRGPQGTLYGSDALSGIVKYVTNAPDPSIFSAVVESGADSVEGGGAGFDVHGMVNIPISADAAFRIVAYDNYYPGFINDPIRQLKDINGSHFTGGRASFLYEPSSDLTIRVSALYQDRQWSDASSEDVNPGSLTPAFGLPAAALGLTPVFGSHEQERLINQPGDFTSQIYNATVNWDLGFAKLLSSTSFSSMQIHALDDFSNEYGALLSGLFGAPTGLADVQKTHNRSVTQEVRLSSQDSGPLEWQVGGFFTNQNGGDNETFYPVSQLTPSTYSIGYGSTLLGNANLPTHYREYAGFANLDYHFTPTLDASIGGRYSDNVQTFRQVASGGLFVGSADYGENSAQDVFTYSGDLRWHPTTDVMLYARIADGFAPGGPNDVIPTAPTSKTYSSSTATNYEVGIKSSLFDGSLTADVSAFYVDWRQIQLEATIGGFHSLVNGGGAASKGIEWSFGYVPLPGLTFNFNGDYTDAYLTQSTPASVGGQIGEQLPAVPLWQTSLAANYERPLFGDYSGFAGVDWRYSDSRYANFSATGPRQEMPSFEIFDLRAGVETQNWTFTFYVQNIGNTTAINFVQPDTLAGGSGPQSAVVNTPRTIGAMVSVSF
jgi:iron complex outermembrane recepter protein